MCLNQISVLPTISTREINTFTYMSCELLRELTAMYRIQNPDSVSVLEGLEEFSRSTYQIPDINTNSIAALTACIDIWYLVSDVYSTYQILDNNTSSK